MVPIYVWRKPIYVRTLFYIQLIFSCSVYVSHHFLVIPNSKYGHTCMARDWVATAYIWIYFFSVYIFCLPVWVSAKFASSVKSLVHIWSHNKWPDTYDHATQLCLYMSGHFSTDQTRMVTRRKCARTSCLDIFRLTRCVWLHDASAFVHVWFFFNWPDAYGHAMQFLTRMWK